jgi:hypothetical protein
MKHVFVENNDMLFGINAILNQPYTIYYITTKVVSSNPANGDVYSIKHYKVCQ